MFNPSLVSKYRGREYEGTLQTAIREFDQISEQQPTFAVERPLNFVQRADCDVAAAVQCLFPKKEIEFKATFHPQMQNHRAEARGHSSAVTDLAFPLVQLAESCRFTPETPNQDFVYYDSNPKQLLDLARILCMEKRLARASKVQLESELWLLHHDPNVDPDPDPVPLSEVPQVDVHQW